jgi:hypothetical protein
MLKLKKKISRRSNLMSLRDLFSKLKSYALHSQAPCQDLFNRQELGLKLQSSSGLDQEDEIN